MDRTWHADNQLGRGATLDERVDWHLAHAAVCGCRTPPASIVAEVETGEVPPLDLLLDWVEESYRAVAPKTLVARLDA